jgi:hypothetical protein
MSAPNTDVQAFIGQKYEAGFVTDIAASWDRAEDEIVRPLTVNPPRTPETVRSGAVAFAEFACRDHMAVPSPTITMS